MTFSPSLTRTDDAQLGRYRVDSIGASSDSASFALREEKSEIDLVKIPGRVFNKSDYPNVDTEIEGDYIPICYGAVRGVKAWLIDSTTKRFKLVDHSIISAAAFYNQDNESFTPALIDLPSGEFTHPSWNGEDELYADIKATGENPIDALELMLTDSTRGASIDSALLDTSSTGKGFGVNGARLDYVYGEDSQTGEELVSLPIGIYTPDPTKVSELTKQLTETAFIIFYVDRAALYQCKAFKPEPVTNDIPTVTDKKIIDRLRITEKSTEPTTQVVVRYNINHGLDGRQTYIYSNDELRQLRGLDTHAIKDIAIPISTRQGAINWAEMYVFLRGIPQRIYKVKTVQEFMELEPGDKVRIKYDRMGVDQVAEVLSVSTSLGDVPVTLELSDIRGWRDYSGFWTADSISFPEDLGGATVTTWDDTWTDAQKAYARAAWGWWTDDNGYVDATDDALKSFRASTWFL
jgi:hypothetical protein